MAALEEQRTDFIQFDYHQLSTGTAADVVALAQACDALADRALLAPDDSEEFLSV